MIKFRVSMIRKSDLSMFCETCTMMFSFTPTPRARCRIWTRSFKFREFPRTRGGSISRIFFIRRTHTRTRTRAHQLLFANLRSTNIPRCPRCGTEFLISLFSCAASHARFIHACMHTIAVYNVKNRGCM